VLQRLIPEIKPYFLNLSLQPKNMPKGLLKKTAFFAEKSGGIDLDLIADDLLSKARELMLSLILIILFATNLTSDA
jgi:hypothetical protein